MVNIKGSVSWLVCQQKQILYFVAGEIWISSTTMYLAKKVEQKHHKGVSCFITTIRPKLSAQQLTSLFITNYLQNDLEPLLERANLFFLFFLKTFLFTFYRKILLLLAKKKRLIWPPNTFFSCSDTYNVLNLKLLPKHFCPFSFFAYIFGPKSDCEHVRSTKFFE